MSFISDENKFPLCALFLTLGKLTKYKNMRIASLSSVCWERGRIKKGHTLSLVYKMLATHLKIKWPFSF